MAAAAMDPVDIANILAQELLYQQVIVDIIVNVPRQGRCERFRARSRGDRIVRLQWSVISRLLVGAPARGIG